MSDLSPTEIEKLILGYEELDAADKTVADHYLQLQPELAARLKWHQDLETQALDAGSSQGDFLNGELLDPADEQTQLDSLHQILAGLAGHQKMRVSSPIDRFRSGARWLLPLAAMLALVVLLPQDKEQRMLLQDLTAKQIMLDPSSSRGTTQPARAEGILRSGQAFALDFTLVEDAFVVVYHVGPKGQVSLAYPRSISDTPVSLEGGRQHQIPDHDSAETWVLSQETGTESFLMAVGGDWPAGLADILTNFDSADREKILAELTSRLEELMPQVELYEFKHTD